MPLAYLTFITGLAISAVAIYYSVLGLASIFAAAVIPIIVMGTILELSKLVAAWWLKSNWHRAPVLLKTYMLIAVIVLMIITSMGIFGFLSKAHTDQAVPLGDVASKVAFIDEKINNERETIANARTLVKQLDDAVAGIQSGEGREIRSRDGTTRIENPAERALQVRRAQANDRAALTKTIDEAQARIVKLQEEKAPIAGQLRAVEAEVGPIKYIAKLIYGDNPDQNLLEKAVVWVIVTIVFVFDPLAVLLLLASQLSFQWARKTNDPVVEEPVKDRESEQSIEEPLQTGVIAQEVASVIPEAVVQSDETLIDAFVVANPEPVVEEQKVDLGEVKEKLSQFVEFWKNSSYDSFDKNFKGFDVPKIQTAVATGVIPSFQIPQDVPVVDELNITVEDWNRFIEEAEKAVEKEKSVANVVWTDALQQWREKNIDADIYEIQRSYDAGEITELPWNEDSRKYKIFPELIEQSSYVQNEEQTQSNLWQETRKTVEVENKTSLSQADYQEKVQQAIIRDLVKNINEGTVSVSDLTDEEVKSIEEYLKKEKDAG
jgi:hypothetical protein